MEIKNPRGTYDLFSRELRLRNKIVDDIKVIMNSYLFEMIETPIFEEKSLFLRTNESDTDIVKKEMYEFLDKKGREMVLRPELTAPVARSFINNKMYVNQKTKLFYYMPAFRYERPQAGRFRQFYQIGVECYAEKLATVDVECISVMNSILKHFDLSDDVTLKINSIGDKESRILYNKVLVSYYNDRYDLLCDDCKQRITSNPLRLLDCKVCSTKEELNNPPKISNYLSEESKVYFNEVLKLLELLDIKYEVDLKLVRGLDYYNDTVFEFVSKKDNQAVCGGGRYDTLLEQISTQSSPAFGFGMGVERLTNILLDKEPTLIEDFNQVADIIYIPLVDEAYNLCYKSMMKLRDYGISCYMNDHIRSLKNSLKTGDKLSCVYAVIIGEDELNEGVISIKNLITREEEKVTFEQFEQELLESGEHDE